MRRPIVALILIGLISAAAFAQKPGTWTVTGSMSTARLYFTATLLPNGKVLVAGGVDNAGNAMSSAELYEPSTGIWTPTGSMATPRDDYAATLLTNGKVLVAGGQDKSCHTTSSAEIYDPDTGAWTLTGSMNVPRGAHVATLFASGPLSGMVLVAGGYINQNDGGCGGRAQVASAELYDPGTGIWTSTGSMKIARSSFSAVTLSDGSVLAVGGWRCCGYAEVNEAESYDPIMETWKPTSPKSTRAMGAAVTMQDGRPFVAGGATGTQPNNKNVPDAELFDSVSGIWSHTAKMSTDRCSHTLTLLGNGQVLAAGGESGGWGVCHLLSSAELYDSAAGRWYLAPRMNIARESHRATLLPNGQVLVIGGVARNVYCSGNALSSAELYTPR